MVQEPIKRVFPGGNTSRGFHSFYEYIATGRPSKIYVVKGGPGVGKSTFMKKVAAAVNRRRFMVEVHHCSSDFGSVDGVYIPKGKIAFIDGTAPHIVDPVYPGAVSEIVHLGDHWDEEAMRENRKEVFNLTDECNHTFDHVFSCLKAAYEFSQIINRETRKLVDNERVNSLSRRLAGRLSSEGRAVNSSREHWFAYPKSRHLFATAFTPQGRVSLLSDLRKLVSQAWVLKGSVSREAERIVEHLHEVAQLQGYRTEAYHCPLDPKRIEHLFLPELDLAVITHKKQHGYQVSDEDEVFEVGEAKEQPDLEEVTRLCDEALNKGFELLKEAKRIHDELESYYIPNMHFEVIDERREKVAAEVLTLLDG